MIVFLLVCSIVATSALVPPQDVLSFEELFEALPQQVKTLISELSSQDIDLLHSLSANFSQIVEDDSRDFDDKLLDLVRNSSLSLGGKFKIAFDSWNRMMDGLSPQAKNFFSQTAQKLRSFSDIENWDISSVMAVLRTICRSEQRLSPSAKNEVRKVFPAISLIFEDPKVKKFFDDTEKMNPEQLKQAMSPF